MRSKTLDEIRPASGGVKLKSRKPRPPKKPPVERPPRVVKDVASPQADLPPPTEEAARLVSEANAARTELMEAMRRINREVMSSSVLPENRSVEQEQSEKDAVHALCNAAIALERLNPGEGLLGMATLAVRQGILLRDAGNRLAYGMKLMERELNGLRRELAELRERVPADEEG
jgi:hypothetical protein